MCRTMNFTLFMDESTHQIEQGNILMVNWQKLSFLHPDNAFLVMNWPRKWKLECSFPIIANDCQVRCPSGTLTIRIRMIDFNLECTRDLWKSQPSHCFIQYSTTDNFLPRFVGPKSQLTEKRTSYETVITDYLNPSRDIK
jgi:hypothetical protein